MPTQKWTLFAVNRPKTGLTFAKALHQALKNVKQRSQVAFSGHFLPPLTL